MWNTKITINLAIKDKDVEAVLKGSESGCSYWCDKITLDPEKLFYNETLAARIINGGPVIFHSKENGRSYDLTIGRVIRGITNYIKKPIYGTILSAEAGSITINSNLITDKIADAVIQNALFGQVLYNMEEEKKNEGSL